MMEREQRLEESNIPDIKIPKNVQYPTRQVAVTDLQAQGFVIGVGPFKNTVYRREGSNLVKVGRLR